MLVPISRNGPTRPADRALVQKPFDQFAKRLFTAVWEGTGVVQTDAEILVDALGDVAGVLRAPQGGHGIREGAADEGLAAGLP